MTEFSSGYIQDGYSRISATYSDFKNAVDFILSLDLKELERKGPYYLQNV